MALVGEVEIDPAQALASLSGQVRRDTDASAFGEDDFLDVHGSSVAQADRSQAVFVAQHSYAGVSDLSEPAQVKSAGAEAAALLGDLDTKIAVIQALIPLGLQAVADLLQQDVTALARYARKDGARHLVRWGWQRGSLYLANQKLSVPVPRARECQTGTEVSLETCTRLQQPGTALDLVSRTPIHHNQLGGQFRAQTV